jgi:hypothetical protein
MGAKAPSVDELKDERTKSHSFNYDALRTEANWDNKNPVLIYTQLP